MATYKAWGPVDEIIGAVGTRKDCVCRRKHYKIDDKGHTVEGKKELYKVCNPRDYEKTPQVGAEKASSDAFSQARQLRIKVQTEMPELLEQWKQAFLRQLEKPDDDSPMNKNGEKKRYVKLDNYMETKIRLRGMNITPSTPS